MLKDRTEESDDSVGSTEDVNMEENHSTQENSDSAESEPVAGPSGAGTSKSTVNPIKKKKKGIIYISSIPKHMNVAILRDMLGQYAQVGRIFLQPGKLPGKYFRLLTIDTDFSFNMRTFVCFSDDDKGKKKKRRRIVRQFTEGWVEFESKRAAKHIAATINNTPIATRKSSKFYDISWSMKYLPRFKWTHLSERLTYEKAVHRQKLQSEISQARKEAAFFQENLDKSEKLKKMKKKGIKAKKDQNAIES